MENLQRKYIGVIDIRREYLPLSLQSIRLFMKKYLPTKVIGGRLLVEREALEKLLADDDRRIFVLS